MDITLPQTKKHYRPGFLALFLCVFIAIPVSAQNHKDSPDSRLSQKQFTLLAATVFRKIRTVKSLKILDNTTLLIEFNTGVKTRTFLGNAYRRYTSKPDNLALILSDFINNLKQIAAISIARKLNTSIIVPVIRHKNYLIRTARRFKAAKQKDTLLFQPFASNLIILFALDNKYGYHYLSNTDLKENKLRFKAIKQYAFNNLDRKKPVVKLVSAGLYMVEFDNNLDASFLLHRTIWQSDKFKVKGDLLAYIPSRNTLIVTGSKDIKNQYKIQHWIDKNRNKMSYFISDTPLRRKNGQWVRYDYQANVP